MIKPRVSVDDLDMYGWVPFVYLAEFGMARCAFVWSDEALSSYSLGAFSVFGFVACSSPVRMVKSWVLS